MTFCEGTSKNTCYNEAALSRPTHGRSGAVVLQVLGLVLLSVVYSNVRAQQCYAYYGTQSVGGPNPQYFPTAQGACAYGNYVSTDGSGDYTNYVYSQGALISGSVPTNNAAYACSVAITGVGSPYYCSVHFCGTEFRSEGNQTGEVNTATTNDGVPPQPCPEYFVQSTPQLDCPTCDKVSDPINPGTGNVFSAEDDVAFSDPSPIRFRRYHNSLDPTGADRVPGWRRSYSRSINTLTQGPSATFSGQSSTVSAQFSTQSSACTSGFGQIQGSVSAWAGATATLTNGVCSINNSSSILLATLPINSISILAGTTTPIEYDLIRDDGQVLRYTVSTSGTITPPPGSSIRLAVTSTGFTVTDDDDNLEVYNTAGTLQSITSRSGIVQNIAYDSNGLFKSVTDGFGNTLTVTRNTQGSIGSISAGGNTVQYAYNGTFTLSGVTNADSTTVSYQYGDTSFPNAMTGEVDESGVVYSSWGYNSAGQGSSAQEAGGASAYTLQYNSSGSVTATDALGAVRTFSYTRIGDFNKVTGISGSQ